PHRVNSFGKLRDVWATGYRSFEVDILFEAGQPGVFRIGHESATSGELFEDFLETVDHSQIEKIWFDLKNLSGTNYQHVLQALESLDAKFGLKNRLILESGTTQKWFKLFRDAGWHTSY